MSISIDQLQQRENEIGLRNLTRVGGSVVLQVLMPAGAIIMGVNCLREGNYDAALQELGIASLSSSLGSLLVANADRPLSYQPDVMPYMGQSIFRKIIPPRPLA